MTHKNWSQYKNRKKFMKKIFLIILVLVAFVETAQAADIPVSSNGADVLSDNAICSLREAIINANDDLPTWEDCPQGADADTIILQNDVTYNLTISGPDVFTSDAGDLDIVDTDALTITTNDPDGEPATIDATDLIALNKPDRIFDINGPSTITINNVVLQNAKVNIDSDSLPNGGCIQVLNATNLTITNSTLQNCTVATTGATDVKGGALYFTGVAAGMTLTNVSMINNLAERTLDNTADLQAAGAAIYFLTDDPAGDANITDSTFSSNTTFNEYGEVEAAVDLASSSSDFDIFINNSTFDLNTTSSNDNQAYGGSLRLVQFQTAEIINSTISNSTLNAATIASGAGIYFSNVSHKIEIRNTTISGNSAQGEVLSTGGGLANDDIAGDLYLSFVTITGNTSGTETAANSQGGGMSVVTPTTIINSIFADNTVLGVDPNGPDCNSVAITSLGHNVITDPSNCAALDGTDDVLVAGSLNALADNGGSTFTHDFEVGYDANDAADADCLDALGVEVTTDQRGAPRTRGSCDVGAYELGTFYDDDDGDGFAGTSSSFFFDNAFVTDDDCNDAEAGINPDAPEICDDFDNDCDDEIDEDFADKGDACSNGLGLCESPGQMVCNGAGDGTECDAVAGDSADEVCDDLDNDCDGETDEASAIDASTWYLDFDGDGFGVPDDTQLACSQPADYTDNTDDCNDDDSTANPSATEVCDGADNDCDSAIDDGFDAGDSCSVGVGACTDTGIMECTDDGTDTECNATAAASSDEDCDDDIDNDCDGDTDADDSDCEVTAGDDDDTVIIDTDADGIADADDNCPDDSNADQLDTDADGEGDECEVASSGGGGCSLQASPISTATALTLMISTLMILVPMRAYHLITPEENTKA